MGDNYKKNTTKERVVIDYISGMTDRFFIASYEKALTDNEQLIYYLYYYVNYIKDYFIKSN